MGWDTSCKSQCGPPHAPCELPSAFALQPENAQIHIGLVDAPGDLPDSVSMEDGIDETKGIAVLLVCKRNGDGLPVSFQLGIMALIIGISIGLPMGILAALKQNTIFDYFGMAVAIFGVSVPVIVLGPILMFIFAVTLKWFPPTGWGAKPPFLLGFLPRSLGWDYFKYAILPAFALGTGSSAIIARLARATLLQVIREDYIRTARAKGLKERLVVTRHALKNALIPVVTVLGPIFAAVVTGSFVTELIFGIPGLGRYFVSSISNRDYPVIMGTILLYAILLVLANLAVDLVYAQLDPRIRYD